MRLERAASAAAVLAAAAALCGCAGGFGFGRARKPPAPPPVDPAVTSAVRVANHLEVVQHLMEGAPADQAQILATAKQAYDTSPTHPSEELEYALVLSTPGHAGFDAAHAEQLLHDALAAPVSLTPSERALALLVVRDLEQQLALVAENRRLRMQSARNDHELMAAASKRLQTETEENARLRKELEQTRAKLNAIANIERSLNRRKPATQGPTP